MTLKTNYDACAAHELAKRLDAIRNILEVRDCYLCSGTGKMQGAFGGDCIGCHGHGKRINVLDGKALRLLESVLKEGAEA